MIIYILAAVSFIVSYFGIKQFRNWSLKRNLLDIPNERSSHKVPTSRGGGLIIALYFTILATAFSFIAPDHSSYGFLLGIVLIGAVSWFDDLYSLPSFLRLFVHLAAALIFVLDVGGFTSIAVPSINSFDLPQTLGVAIAVIWIVWVVNAYNFMDGIDGLAGIQAILAGVGWLAIGLYYDIYIVQLISVVITATSLGFLLHNWSPATIFMGDVGSAFLGFVFAGLPLLAMRERPDTADLMPVTAAIFLWLFLTDVSLTLVKRIANVKKIWQPHREHFYQRMVIAGYSHSKVSIIYAILTAACISTALVWHFFSGMSGLLTLFTLVMVILLVVRMTIRSENTDDRVV